MATYTTKLIFKRRKFFMKNHIYFNNNFKCVLSTFIIMNSKKPGGRRKTRISD